MPKSKRERVVHLTQTKKKTRAVKEQLVEKVRECLEQFTNVYVLSINNPRNERLKHMRMEWSNTGRFFFGKNRVMAVALGRTKESEQKDNLVKVARSLAGIGQRGLFFTNSGPEEIRQYMGDIKETNFARAGCIATDTVKLEQGELDPAEFPFSVESNLRKLGLPTELKNGIIHLRENVKICSKGDVLTSNQAKLLEMWGIKMAVLSINVHCHWSDGKFEEYIVDNVNALNANDDDVVMG